MTDHATLAERLGPLTPVERWLASPGVAKAHRPGCKPDGMCSWYCPNGDALGLNGRAMRTSSPAAAERDRKRRRRAGL